MNNTVKKSDFLFPKRNFWTGFSSILDVFAQSKKFHTSTSGSESDLKALRNDWEMIGNDFKDTLVKLTGNV